MIFGNSEGKQIIAPSQIEDEGYTLMSELRPTEYHIAIDGEWVFSRDKYSDNVIDKAIAKAVKQEMKKNSPYSEFIENIKGKTTKEEIDAEYDKFLIEVDK